MTEVVRRADVPTEETWDLEAIYPSSDAYEEALAGVPELVAQVTAFAGRLADDAEALVSCLRAYQDLLVRLRRVGAYAHLRLAEDGTDPERQARSSRLSALSAEWHARLSFLESEILDIPDDRLRGWLAEDPRLEPYRATLAAVVRDKPHRLSPETEAALAALGEVLHTPGAVYRRAMASDVRYAPFRDAGGRERANSYLLYEDRFERAPEAETRRNAYASFVSGLRAYRHTFAATMAAEVRRHATLARLRRYESATHMILDHQEVPVEAYHRQLDVLQAEVAPHFRRLARLRRRVLGLDRLLYCDLEAPLDPGGEREVSYDHVAATILEALSALGGEYRDIIDRSLRERWIDRAANVGKGNSRFCSSVYGVHPYICTGWTGTMRSAFILAHELGHAGHSMVYMARQSAIDSLWPPHALMNFVEAPSTGNELLLHAHLTRTAADERARRQATLQLLPTYHHNFIRHLLEGELQRRMFARAEAGGGITANWLDAEQEEILATFWGDTLEIDEGAKMTWMRQPHYYSGLYSYTYSVGLTVATAAVPKIAAGDQAARDGWLAALAAGPTRTPQELALIAGVDMGTAAPLHAAAAFVGGLVDQLESAFAGSPAGHPPTGTRAARPGV